MEDDFWMSELKAHLSRRPDLCNALRAMGVQVYLFGSGLTRDDPNDLDLAFLYPESTQIASLISLRNAVINHIYVEYQKPIDQITISIEEDKSIEFLASESARLINI